MKRRPMPWGRMHPAKKLLGYAGLLTLGLLGSCEKNKEVICTETCCDTYANRYKYITEIKNAEADFANGGFWLKNPINGVNGIIVCALSSDKITGLKNTFDPKDIANLPFAYRISGKIYDNLDDITLSGEPIYDIRLDSAVKIK